MRRRVRIAELMAREGVTSLSQLAKRMGVDKSTLSLWQRGLSRPSEPVRERVAERLGLPEAWVFPIEIDTAPAPIAECDPEAVPA